jgi:hypothetical protein
MMLCHRLGHQPQAKREPRSVLCYACQYNSPVDSTFEQSENVAIAHFLMKSWSSCYCILLACSALSSEECGLRNGRFKVHSAFICARVLGHAFVLLVPHACILATLSHVWDIKHTKSCLITWYMKIHNNENFLLYGNYSRSTISIIEIIVCTAIYQQWLS